MKRSRHRKATVISFHVHHQNVRVLDSKIRRSACRAKRFDLWSPGQAQGVPKRWKRPNYGGCPWNFYGILWVFFAKMARSLSDGWWNSWGLAPLYPLRTRSWDCEELNSFSTSSMSCLVTVLAEFVAGTATSSKGEQYGSPSVLVVLSIHSGCFSIRRMSCTWGDIEMIFSPTISRTCSAGPRCCLPA